MQKSSLEKFEKDINNIREYIIHIGLIDNVARIHRNSDEESLKKFHIHFKEFRFSKKEFEYKAIIISLYGILENTVSKWIQEHIQNISTIVNDYSRLKEKFKKVHFNQSIQLLYLINEKRHSKLENINKENVVKKLNQTIVSPENFDLNSEAYIPLSGNLKHSKIVEAFKPLDIDLNSFESSLHREIIKIDDLVSRRNDIAHGVEIDNILGTTEFEDFISELENYMITIFKIIDEKEVEYQFKYQNRVYIDEPTELFVNNTICIVNIKDIELKIDDTLFIEKNNQYSKATILDIQINNTSVESANNGELGLQLSSPIKKNSKIWKKAQ